MTDLPDPSAGKADVDRWGFAVALPSTPASPTAPSTRSSDPKTASPGPARHRQRWLVAAAIAVVLTAGAAAALVLSGGDESVPSAPDAVVRTYLTDLSRADADGALAQGARPADRLLLTAAVLHQQRKLAALTAIQVAPPRVDKNTATVTAHYRLGSTAVAAEYPLVLRDGRWQLRATTFGIDVSALGGLPEPTLFGQPISGLATVHVFPGPLVWGSSNRFYAITPTANGYPTSPTDATPDIRLHPSLNPAGVRAVHSAVMTYLATCSASHDVRPKGCPQQEDTTGAVSGSVHWAAPHGVTRLHVVPGDPATTLDVHGSLVWRCTFRVRSGHKVVDGADHVQADVVGTIDLTRAVPVFTTES